MLLEYADRGALDKANAQGRFRKKSDNSPDLVCALSTHTQNPGFNTTSGRV